MLKIKKLIKSLDSARGNGYGTASNITSRVNRLSVLATIIKTQQRLKLYNRVPPNGLVFFVGTILTDEGKEKKVSFDFEPHKLVDTSLYLYDNKFHTEALSELLKSDSRFGFIVMDGNGTLFGTLAGNTREVIHKFTVDLPKKHGRGGQSALRFSRLRDEKRNNYVNVTGLVLAGSADFKTELGQSDMFDLRLGAKVVDIRLVICGGDRESLANVKFVQEKRLIQKYFDEISQDTGKYCFGIKDMLKALELGAVETLIVWENLDITRYILRNAAGEEIVIYPNKEQDQGRTKFLDKCTGLEMEQSEEPFSLFDSDPEKSRFNFIETGAPNSSDPFMKDQRADLSPYAQMS
ncbi:translation release factor [Desarmillaria tabescens]|uniref:Translation release factor n=1 Tax=Armillaria tabescens TaxID=1929756 RepID=A0AA39MHW2_ARMTA|nr:translation release factor [Desarmillaria tabescens]KAK0434045.1 translation release factor [Desarmillaria tabescens]